MEKNLTSKYWNKMLDMIINWGRFQNLVNSRLVDDVIGLPIRKEENLKLIVEYTNTASVRFRHILFALDNLKEIEKQLQTSMDLTEDDEISFKTEYHFFAFIGWVSSFLNCLAWLLKFIYNIKIKRRQDVDIRKNKPLIQQIEKIEPSLYEIISKNLDEWIEETLNFRDVLLHRRDMRLIGANGKKLYMPIHPEIATFVDTDFEREESYEERMNRIRWKKGNITQPMIPFCENVVKRLAIFSQKITKFLLSKIS